MPNSKKIVINTGPLLSLIAGMGNLDILDSLYEQIIVPFEVCEEILNGGPESFGIREFTAADFLFKIDHPTEIYPYLRASYKIAEMCLNEQYNILIMFG